MNIFCSLNQTLSAVRELKIQPHKKMMHLVLEAYANAGDTVGAENVFGRMQSMGLTPTSDTINIILKSIVKSSGDLDWDAISFCYSEYFGFQKFVADIGTYTQLMAACEKYDRPEQATFWFNEMLSVGLHITPPLRDSFKRIIGGSEYRDYCDGLIPEFQVALSYVDKKTKPYPGRHTADSIAAGRNRIVDEWKSVRSELPVQPSTMIKAKTAPAPMKMREKWMTTLKSLKELGTLRNVAPVKTKVDELIAEGLIPPSVLLEHLVYAHLKAYDTKGAQLVVDGMKSSKIDISLKTFHYLVSSYSNDGDGVGAQRAALEAAAFGYSRGQKSDIMMMTRAYCSDLIFTFFPDALIMTQILRAYRISGSPAEAEKVPCFQVDFIFDQDVNTITNNV
jgi:pentatricopeptide repeat protein